MTLFPLSAVYGLGATELRISGSNPKLKLQYVVVYCHMALQQARDIRPDNKQMFWIGIWRWTPA